MDRGKRTLLLIAIVSIAPVVASYLAYYLWPDAAKMNYGELLTPPPSGAITGRTLPGSPAGADAAQGRWTYVSIDSGACEARCQAKLYASRQTRKLQIREEHRVVRLFLVTDDLVPSAELRAAHPDLAIVRVDPGSIAWLFGSDAAAEHIYLLDPLGNAILRYPADPDIKRMSKDIGRLLKASRVG